MLFFRLLDIRNCLSITKLVYEEGKNDQSHFRSFRLRLRLSLALAVAFELSLISSRWHMDLCSLFFIPLVLGLVMEMYA